MDHHFLWKQTIIVLNFLHRCSYEGEIARYNTSVGWVWPDVSSHVQTGQNLSGSNFGWSVGGMVTLKIIQSERLIEF